MDQPVASSSSAIPAPTSSFPVAHQPVRLTHEGIKVRRDFFDNVSKNPTKEQYQQLLEQIRAVPGCSHITLERMKKWFQSRRSREKVAAKPPAILPTRALCKRIFPSFDGPKIVKYLHELMHQYPDPAPEIMALWAQQLGIQLVDVDAWMKMEITKETKPNMADLESSLSKRQLPTPQSTASPEPSEKDESPPLRKLQTVADAIIVARQQPSGLSSPQDIPRVTSLAEFTERFAPFDAAFQRLNVTFQSGNFTNGTLIT